MARSAISRAGSRNSSGGPNVSMKVLIAAAASAAIVSATAIAQQRPPAAAPQRPAAARPAAAPAQSSGMSAADRATASQYNQKEAIALQVTLDKEGFSPGEIDGTLGKNTLRALEAYEGARQKKAVPAANGGLREHTLTGEDVA